MNLHNNTKFFRDAILATSQYLTIREVFIEKDYWVTYTLKKLSESSFKNKVIFKGGTSLSKAYKLIKRFSEDVDLTVIFPATNNLDEIENLIVSIEDEITRDFNEIVVEELTHKTEQYRKTLHEYEKILSAGLYSGDLGQATDKIMLEINSYGTTHPHRQMSVQSYIADYLEENSYYDEINRFGLQSFPLLVLDHNRTVVEKIAAIARACFLENFIDELIKKIRHIYDIYLLCQDSEIRQFLNSESFFELLDKVDKEDSSNPFVPDETIGLPFSDAKIFSEPEKLWKKLEPTYKGGFKRLVFGKLPDSDEIIKCLSYLHSRLTDYDLSRVIK